MPAIRSTSPAPALLSAFDLKNNFVATYLVQAFLSIVCPGTGYACNQWMAGWQESAALISGFPATLHEDGDNSLQGSSPNGVNNHYLDVSGL